MKLWIARVASMIRINLQHAPSFFSYALTLAEAYELIKSLIIEYGYGGLDEKTMCVIFLNHKI